MTASAHDAPAPRNRPVFWISVAAGWAVMAFGVRGLLHEEPATNPEGFARLFLGAALVHDLVVAPLVLGAGLAVARLVPRRARALVQAGLLASAFVALYSYPFVRGYGRADTNPSALPLDYGRGLAVVLGLIWLAVAVALVASARRRAAVP